MGKTGTIDNAYINESDKRTGYYLNDDGTATTAAQGPKASITKGDAANDEPGTGQTNASPITDAATVMGMTSEVVGKGLEKGGQLVDDAAKVAAAGSNEAAQLSGLVKQVGAVGNVLKGYP